MNTQHTYTQTRRNAVANADYRIFSRIFSPGFLLCNSSLLIFRYALSSITATLKHSVALSEDYLLARHALHLLDDLCLLVSCIQVRYISCVKYHADVFHERLVFDLTVGEQKHGVLPFTSSFQQ